MAPRQVRPREFLTQWDSWLTRRLKNSLACWMRPLSSRQNPRAAACSGAPSAGQDAPSAILVGKRRALLDKGHRGLVFTERFRANSKETGVAVMLGKTNWKRTSSAESIKVVIHNIFFKDEKNAKPFYFSIFPLREVGSKNHAGFRIRRNHVCQTIYSPFDPSTSCASSILLN